MFDWILAVSLGGAGIAALYASWRGWRVNRPWIGLAGWGLLGLSAWCWVRAAGAEFGIGYAFLFATFAAWMAVLVNLEVRDRKRRDQQAGQATVPDRQTVSRHVARFFVAVPLAAVVSACLGVALLRLIPLGRIDAMAAAVLGVPVLWGVVAYWACADTSIARPAFSLATVGALATGFVFVLR